MLKKTIKMIHAQNFIGKDIVVSNSAHTSYVGLSGSVVFESKYGFVVGTGANETFVAKNGSVFSFSGQVVNGKDIIKTPLERIKVLS